MLALSRKRWLRFSLRTMLLFVTLVLAPLGWYVNRCERQRQAVATIVAGGGKVEYQDYRLDDNNWQGSLVNMPEPFYWKSWLKKRGLPRDWQDEVTEIDLSNSSNLSAAIASLPNCRRFKRLKVDATNVTHADLKTLARLSNIQKLTLRGEGIGKCLLGLQGMKLKSLDLAGLSVTDQDLNALTAFPDVDDLDVCLTSITDAGLAQIGRMPKLRNLALMQNCITDAGLLELHSLTRLKGLWLNDTCIQGEGLAHLPRQLDSLVLWSRRLDYEQVPKLAELHSLTSICVSAGPEPNPEAATAIRAALPNTYVDFKWSVGCCPSPPRECRHYLEK